MKTKSEILSEIIHDRKSVRKYDQSHIIPEGEIKEMLNEAVRAPSSSNLQPWKFLIIQDKDTKKQTRDIAFGQEAVETCSTIIAVIADKEMYQNINPVSHADLDAGFVTEEVMRRKILSANKFYPTASEEARLNIATFDTGLVSMQLMLIAKARGYDTVCIGGFNKQQFKETFNLPDRFAPVVLICIGKAGEPAFETTRMPLEESCYFI